MDPGQRIADRFEIEGLAAAGGMSTVYRATDLHTGGHVALKVLRDAKPALIARFAREARALATLEHPAIVRYVAHGQGESNLHFLATEWLEGTTLAKRLQNQGPLRIEEVLEALKRMGEGLALIHQRGLVHRDIKPSNLLLVDDRAARIKLLDFGVARLRDTSLTHTGIRVGTPAYMAPEQARGSRNVDSRTDIFSLGCVAFESLVGRPPFEGDDEVAVLLRVVLESAPSVRSVRSEVPSALDSLIARMLSKQPEVRPQDGAALLSELRNLEAPHETLKFAPVPSVRLTQRERQILGVLLGGTPSATGEISGALTWSPDENPDLTVVRSMVTRQGGDALRLAEGTFVAMFQSTGGAADLATRAARCALGVHQVSPTMPLALSMGWGEVEDRFPMGEVIERAARLLRAEQDTPRSTPRRIRVDELTAGLLAASFEIVGESDHRWLTGELDLEDAQRTLLGKPTPFLGREQELAILAAAWRGCVQERSARALLIVGPPGIGKSRLRAELARQMKTEYPAETWHSRADSVSGGSPFALLAPAIRHAARIAPGETNETGLEKLRRRVAQNIPPSEADRVTVFLGELAGISFPSAHSAALAAARHDPQLMADQTRRAWEDWLTAETMARPLVLILEDLQWADVPSLRYVDAALGRLREAPFLVLASGRPELRDQFPDLWSEHGVAEVRLAPLSARACERLVNQAARALDEEARLRVVERSAGNPFFLEELIRAQIEGKGAELPQTAVALAQSRLERLSEEARHVLRAASVFGEVFWTGGVAALLGGATQRGHVAEWLQTLGAREIVVRRTDSRFPSEEEFSFRHALVREAAYGTLTDRDREIGHHLAANWLQEVGERDARAIASHHERGGVKAWAILWYTTAAEQALSGNDLESALVCANRGVDCGAVDGELGILTGIRTEIFYRKGELQAAEENGLVAMGALPTDNERWYRTIGDLAAASQRLAHQETLDRLLSALEHVTPTPPTERPRAMAVTRIASALLYLQRPEDAAELLRKEDLLMRRHRDDPLVAAAMSGLALSRAYAAGNPMRLLHAGQEVHDRFADLGDLRTSCNGLAHMGYALVLLGAFEQGAERLSEAEALAARLGLKLVIAGAHHNLGAALACLGRIDEAIAMEQSAALAFAKAGHSHLEGASRAYLARFLVQCGNAESAQTEALRALELLQGHRQRAYALAVLADIELARKKPAEALNHAQAAHAVLAEVGRLAEGEALVRIKYVEALMANGHEEAARDALLQARDSLLERSLFISDEQLRKSFLERVPENALTLQLALEESQL